MKKLKIYLDTSVIGGSFDDGFKEHSIRLIKNIKKDYIVGVISEITIRELENAPEFVKKDFETYEEKLELVVITEDLLKTILKIRLLPKNTMKTLYILLVLLCIKLIYL